MEFRIFDLGLVDFEKAWQFQKRIFKEIRSGDFASALILCSHYPVITIGRQGKKENIKAHQDELEALRIGIYEIERGGDVTYHGPGQLTAYPIFNLNYLKKDIHFFLKGLEATVIDFLTDFKVAPVRQKGLTGAWIGPKKIASIGIAIKNWIAFHGISINIKKSDLQNFGLIKPCGMDIEMTSLESVLQRDVEIANIKDGLIGKFQDNFNLRLT